MKKAMEYENDNNTNCNWCSWYNHRRISTRTGVLGNKGRVETIQTTVLLRSARILRGVLETWGDLLSLKLQWEAIAGVKHSNNDNNKRPSANTDVKNSEGVIIIIIIIIIMNKRERICKIVDFSVPADHRIKLKECEKKDKYLYLARELKRLWNMKVTNYQL